MGWPAVGCCQRLCCQSSCPRLGQPHISYHHPLITPPQSLIAPSSAPPPRRVHGNALKWLLWVEDSDNEHIYHSGGRACHWLRPAGAAAWATTAWGSHPASTTYPYGQSNGLMLRLAIRLVGPHAVRTVPRHARAVHAVPCAETWILTKKMMREGEQRVAFTVPIFEPLPSQYYIRVVSDQVGGWAGQAGAETGVCV